MATDLTVIVKNTEGKLVEGATVTATPQKTTGTTDNKGEAMLALKGDARKYEVTVANDNMTQTVPFYVIDGQKTARLEVNLQYFKQLNAKKATTTTAKEQPATPWYQSSAVLGGGLALLVVAAVIVVLWRKRRNKLS